MKNQSKFAQFKNELEALNKEEMKVVIGGYGGFAGGSSAGGGSFGGGSFAHVRDNTYVSPPCITSLYTSPQSSNTSGGSQIFGFSTDIEGYDFPSPNDFGQGGDGWHPTTTIGQAMKQAAEYIGINTEGY